MKKLVQKLNYILIRKCNLAFFSKFSIDFLKDGKFVTETIYYCGYLKKHNFEENQGRKNIKYIKLTLKRFL